LDRARAAALNVRQPDLRPPQVEMLGLVDEEDEGVPDLIGRHVMMQQPREHSVGGHG
jgi:hypothetical protein